MLNLMLKRLGPPLAWPTIEKEMGDYLAALGGKVLNAGAGNRDLSPYVHGELVNQDIETGLHNENIQIYSPLDCIPVVDQHFDAIICNAVLEHVRNPDEVMHEFHRVLKPGGHLYLCVPFMQPEHLDPTDFQRYTLDGLKTLANRHGFNVIRSDSMHSVYHTLAWIVHEWLTSRPSIAYTFLACLLYPTLYIMTRISRDRVHRVASAYRILAIKRAGPIQVPASTPQTTDAGGAA